MAQIELPEGIDRDKVIFLTLKWKWFVQIWLRIKKEEYRSLSKTYKNGFEGKEYIHFRNGYADDCPAMIVELLGHSVGKGNSELGAPVDEEVNILHLGRILYKPDFITMEKIAQKRKTNEPTGNTTEEK